MQTQRRNSKTRDRETHRRWADGAGERFTEGRAMAGAPWTCTAGHMAVLESTFFPHTSPWPKDSEVRSLLSSAWVRDSLVSVGLGGTPRELLEAEVERGGVRSAGMMR